VSRAIDKPNIPPESCEHIDRVMELSESLAAETDDEICAGYNSIIKEECELIRTINSQLRVASKFWHDRYKRRRS